MGCFLQEPIPVGPAAVDDLCLAGGEGAVVAGQVNRRCGKFCDPEAVEGAALGLSTTDAVLTAGAAELFLLAPAVA
jgi:hypothetical protein